MNDRMRARIPSGFTLIELMIAMAIGLIATIGIVTLFDGTSRTNRLQEGLARLQENGRYAALRLEDDLRMAGALYCSTQTGNRQGVSAAAPLWADRPISVFAASLNLPDSGGMLSVDPLSGAQSTIAATAPYDLSARFFMQGHSCTTGTSCTPALWNASMFPPAGNAAGNRVPESDILTVRYLRGSGWPLSIVDPPECTTGGTVTLLPQTGDDPLNFPTGSSLAMVAGCGGSHVIPVNSFSGSVLNLGTMLGTTADAPTCSGSAKEDRRVFNFSTDFVTVTYYLAFRANDDPDARPNFGSSLSLVPTLIRRENGVEQELVRGVDDLDFRYGVRDNAGNMRFLTAAQVDNRLGGAITCPAKSMGVAPTPDNPLVPEPGCLWRSVRRIEASLLVNSGDEVAGLDDVGRSFRYMGVLSTPAESDSLPSGILAMNLPRREFIAQATHRNKNP